MTKLRKTSEQSDHVYAHVRSIDSVAVDGNTTHMELEVGTIILSNGKMLDNEKIIVEIETLELIQTFNTTWTNHAVGKVRQWLNQVIK